MTIPVTRPLLHLPSPPLLPQSGTQMGRAAPVTARILPPTARLHPQLYPVSL